MIRTQVEIDAANLYESASLAAESLRNLRRYKSKDARQLARQLLQSTIAHFENIPDDWARAEEASAREALNLFDGNVAQ